jgi:hypothetical protein
MESSSRRPRRGAAPQRRTAAANAPLVAVHERDLAELQLLVDQRELRGRHAHDVGVGGCAVLQERLGHRLHKQIAGGQGTRDGRDRSKLIRHHGARPARTNLHTVFTPTVGFCGHRTAAGCPIIPDKQ